MSKVHFGDFKSLKFSDTIKLCGKDLLDFPRDQWTHREKDVTCKECLLKLKKKKTDKKLIRKVKCLLCKEKMFYSEDPKWEPEFLIIVELNHGYIEDHYVHQRCWKDFKKTPLMSKKGKFIVGSPY